nr:retrovirus-related Pol polyprotein from transposon TNT 1-94 [Tanacetum cinerariifolium]
MTIEYNPSVKYVEVMTMQPQDTILLSLLGEVSYLSPLSLVNSQLRHIREPIWYLDSGCSKSMIGVKSYLHKYEEQPCPKGWYLVITHLLLPRDMVQETIVDEVSDDEEMTQVKVLMALADDELVVGKNHARNDKWIDITMRKVKILLSIDEDADWKIYLKYIMIDLKAPPNSEVMPLTYQDHSPKERPGLGTMKHTKLETQESLSKSVLGPVTLSNTEPVISLVPTEVKNNEQESKINKLTKLV